jgi:arabinofuranan 3-O-arabinosyltransferase
MRDRFGQVGSLAAVLWALALASFANLVLRSYAAPRPIGDFTILHDGAGRLVDGASVYLDPFFLLTPSALFLVGPFGLLDPHPAFLLWNTLSVLAALVGVVCATRFVGAPVTGPVGAALLLGLSMSESLTSTLLLGNLNNSLLLALGGAYLWAERADRRVLAGVLLGLALAVKPVFVLVLLLPLLRRSWRTLAWAVAIPAVLNLVGLWLVPHRGDFLAVAVPHLLEARQAANSSIWAVGTYLGLPGWAVVLLRVLVGVVALAAVWRLRSHPDPVLRLGVSYGLLLLATFLSSSLSEGYYSMLLLPLLATALRAGSPMRNPVSWLAVYLFLTLDSWSVPQLPGLSADFAMSRWTVGWLVLFVLLARWAFAAVRDVSRTTAAAPEESREDVVAGEYLVPSPERIRMGTGTHSSS